MTIVVRNKMNQIAQKVDELKSKYAGREFAVLPMKIKAKKTCPVCHKRLIKDSCDNLECRDCGLTKMAKSEEWWVTPY